MKGYVCLFVVVMTGVTLGCHTVGTTAVRGAQAEYSTALLSSWNKQLLLNLVRLRYGEPPLFLEISSLSTQHSLELGAHFEPLWARPDATEKARSLSGTGWSASRTKSPGSGDEYGHSAGFDYYERPTVTYTPLQGQEYVTRLHTPIGLDTILLLTRSGWDVHKVNSLCTQRICGLPNAPSASGPTPNRPPEYEEFAHALRLVEALRDEGFIHTTFRDHDGKRSLCLVVKGEDPRLDELETILGLDRETERFVYREWSPEPDPKSIQVQTRSFLGALYYLANSVQVPEEHVKKGWVVNTLREDGTPFDWSEVTGSFLTIHSSPTPPADALVSVKHEGYWFYIDKADLDSKYTFVLARTLFALLSGDIPDEGPTLTLPVGK